MVLAVKTWALGHLISNGNLADVALFGGFLLWAVLDFRAARSATGPWAPATPAARWRARASPWCWGRGLGAFAFWGHALLIGISPLGR
jgi:uncharacterized membrane protein